VTILRRRKEGWGGVIVMPPMGRICVRVLMLGWEFPPYFAGGVGTVCYELTKALAARNVPITYIMPHGPDEVSSQHLKLLVASKEMRSAKIRKVPALIEPYQSKEEYLHSFSKWGGMKKGKALYGKNLLEEMYRFAQAVVIMCEEEEFDVIHAHDWTTIPAALALKKRFHKPLVLHVHITEFDKTGGEHADPDVYRIEYDGFQKADKIIAVSNLVRQRLIRQYYVDPSKIEVVYNGVENPGACIGMARERISEHDRLVLFLGRVTLQKGPDYFLEAARKVSMMMPDVKFVVAGTGDMLPRMIERAAEMGLGNRVIFPGFVTREEGDKLYRMADLFVMPSVSEPFGIVPLEAMRMGTPVIVSRQSGVSEVLHHALKVDFWDTDALANKIVATLTYGALHDTIRYHGTLEVQRFTWETPAQRCIDIYGELIQRKILVEI
jgi:glycosyltransferase involved in cell wall biosynthesis